MIKPLSTCLLAITISLLPLPASADPDSEAKGLAIAKEMKARDRGWGNSQSQMTMTLRTKGGDEVVREMRTKALEVTGDGDKALTIFDTPLDVKGTTFLSFSHTEGDDDQWIYLPAVKRVKRIASRNKSGPFLGSEFAFEDLSSFEVEKYQFDFQREETINGLPGAVIVMDPVDKYSGYTKIIAWVDTAHYRPHKLEFYDRRDTLLKTLTISDYKQYKNKYWRASTQVMVNHKTGKSTDILLKNIEFDVGLSDADFNENRLNRAR
ncbi:membrane protein [Arenicella chitinivorans]|uniref:Membrane protein n=1 Tax=Arenicella chitinivorans TaxID=1329800 RepID=A0A918RY18_9GAMM|nr:outer membrane lipoprotein-sorting protein [Arenicella chitinivorans]GHA16855.1 membrane protein [Arenicella chitinivorans]